MSKPEKKPKDVAKDAAAIEIANAENVAAEEAARLRSTLPKTIEELEAIIADFTEKHPEQAATRQDEFDSWRALYK